MPRDFLKKGPLSSSQEQIVGADSSSTAVDMPTFLKEVDGFREEVEGLKRKVKEIEQFHSKTLNGIDHQKQLDHLMDAANKDIRMIKAKLNAVEQANKRVGASDGSSLTGDLQIRYNQYTKVSKLFVESIREYQDMQNKYKVKYKDRLERQVKIVKPNATPDEIKQVLEGGSGGGQQLFAQQVIGGAQHAEAKRALYDIQERHQDIMKIEQSVLELNQLFMDMAILVNAQGDMLNSIETNVMKTNRDVEMGVKETRAAVKLQRKSRARLCWILGGVLLLIVVSIIIGTVTRGK